MKSRKKVFEYLLQLLYGLETSQDKTTQSLSPRKQLETAEPSSTSFEGEVRILNAENVSAIDIDNVIVHFFEFFDSQDELRETTKDGLKTLLSVIPEIDMRLNEAGTKWRIDRMSVVDRNIIRLALWESQSKERLSKGQVVQRALDLATRFGSDTSIPFINGVLDALLTEP